MKIGIIGSGIAGMAAAVRLASLGANVHVFERNAFPGGKLSSFEIDNYRFDAGPSLFTMPHLIEDLFAIAKRDIHSYFSYEKLDEACHYFWEDGTTFIAPADLDSLAREIAATFGISLEKIKQILKDSKRKYEITSPVFLEQSLHRWKNYFNLPTLRGVLHLPVLDIFTSMNGVNQRVGHPKVTQLLNRYATYNGSDPYQAPGVLTSIPYLEHGIGTFFPKGGMFAITEAIYKLGVELGVKFHFNSGVDEIIVQHKKAVGIKIAQNSHYFDKIISNIDIYHTYTRLLPHEKYPKKTLEQPKSSSALIFYWGIRKNFAQLGLHNIFFSEDYKAEFEHIFQKKAVWHDPTVYINISQKHAPSDAPAGCENWFVMVNVPHNEGQDWESLQQTVRRHVMEKVSRLLKTDIAALIACEHTLDPFTIEQRTGSHLGALYGTSSNNRMAAFLRHPNFSTQIKNLYFCGGSVHPGGGIPLCLLSAKIVSEELANEY